jgi:hypothetical protein
MHYSFIITLSIDNNNNISLIDSFLMFTNFLCSSEMYKKILNALKFYYYVVNSNYYKLAGTKIQ